MITLRHTATVLLGLALLNHAQAGELELKKAKRTPQSIQRAGWTIPGPQHRLPTRRSPSREALAAAERKGGVYDLILLGDAHLSRLNASKPRSPRGTTLKASASRKGPDVTPWDEAEGYYRRAVKRSKNTLALVRLADLLSLKAEAGARSEARRLYRQAAEKGDSEAMRKLAATLQQADEPQDELRVWLQLAAEHEVYPDLEARGRLALLLLPEDPDQAVLRYLTRWDGVSAQVCSPQALLVWDVAGALVERYMRERTEVDGPFGDHAALLLADRLDECGPAQAQAALKRIQSSHDPLLSSATQQEALEFLRWRLDHSPQGEAQALLKRSAVAGHPEAMYRLSQRTQKGSKDQLASSELTWLKQAAKLGHPQALGHLRKLQCQAAKTCHKFKKLQTTAGTLAGPGDLPLQ